MSDTMGDLLRLLDEQERLHQKTRGLVMQLFMEAADRGPVTIPAATHDFVPPQHVAPFCSPEEPDA